MCGIERLLPWILSCRHDDSFAWQPPVDLPEPPAAATGLRWKDFAQEKMFHTARWFDCDRLLTRTFSPKPPRTPKTGERRRNAKPSLFSRRLIGSTSVPHIGSCVQRVRIRSLIQRNQKQAAGAWKYK